MFTIRLHRDSEEFKIQTITDKFPNSFFVEEHATRTHIQGLIDTQLSHQTLRNHLKSLGFKGNQDFSITVCKDREKYVHYLCKGTKDEPPVVIYNTLFTEQQIAELHESWVHDKKKLKKNTISQIFEGFNPPKCSDSIPVFAILEHVQQWFIENGRLYSSRLVMQYAETFIIQTYEDYRQRDLHRMTQDLYEKI